MTSEQLILVVDDNELNRDLLSRRLIKQGYQVALAENGCEALNILENQNIALLLLDIMMPKMNGYQVLEQMKSDEILRHVPVIVISAAGELGSAVKCIEMGAEDYLSKPFDPVVLRARVSACLEKKHLYDQQERFRIELKAHNERLEDRVREQVKEISSAQLAAIFSMSKLAESKDPETGAHLERMREYCKLLSEQLRKCSQYADTIDERFIDTIYASSPLHDIGKVGVPDNILLKPGKLDAHEWKIMKTHSRIGADTLKAVHEQHPGNAFIQMGIEIAQSHHEKWDGSGYPDALSGKQIPPAARILSLGDVYDALTSKRCYKEAFSHAKSREIILDGKDTHFDPDVVAAFLEAENEFLKIREYFGDPNE